MCQEKKESFIRAFFSPRKSLHLGIVPGLEGQEEELPCLKFKSCCVCAVSGVADVLFLAG